MITLCIFRASEYGTGITGLKKADLDGAVYEVAADLSTCSYSSMFNVRAMSNAVVKCLGADEVEIGVFRTHNGATQYVSLDDMDEAAHHVKWSDIESGFELTLKWRKTCLEQAKFALDILSREDYIPFNFASIDINILSNIGKVLMESAVDEDNNKIQFDKNALQWEQINGNKTFPYDMKTGKPVF